MESKGTCSIQLVCDSKPGEKTVLDRMLQTIGSPGKVFDCSKIIPEPEFGGTDEWCRDNWGSKSNAQNAKMVSRNDSRLIIKFDAAFRPPIFVIFKLMEMFPEIGITLDSEETPHGYGHHIQRLPGACLEVRRGITLMMMGIRGALLQIFDIQDVSKAREQYINPAAFDIPVNLFLEIEPHFDVDPQAKHRELRMFFKLAGWPEVMPLPI